ncbi:MAG TPA: helix-turn-helix domain-containing protein [Candidatus Limnocylindria bacterium]|nr:helix-turn-helix domain-containing protein [Candidatus Limnocylindria bacterium]
MAAPPAGPQADLVAALEAALAEAFAGGGVAVAFVGVLAPGEPTRTREQGTLEPRVRETLLEVVSRVPDGRLPGLDHGWLGYRGTVGDGRTAFAIVQGKGEAAAGRSERAVLVLIRAALLAGDRRRSDRLQQLLSTARRVAESVEVEPLLSDIVQDAARLVGADSGDVLLWDRDREVLRVVAVWNFPPEMIGFELAFGEGLSSQAILAQRTVSVEDYGSYPHRAKALDNYDFGAVLCSPLMVRGEAVGALNVHARSRSHRFGADDADLMAAFAGHAAIAIDNATRYANEVRLGRIAADTNRELTRSLTVQRRLVEQVLTDGGPRGIAAVLAEHLDRRVVIQDHLHRLIAGAAPGGGEEWRGLLEPARGIPDPFSVAVRVGRDVVGHLLLSSDDALGPIDRALVDIATTGAALEFAKLRAASEVEERLRGEAIGDLLSGTYPSEDAIATRVARLGHDLSQPRDLLVLGAAQPESVQDRDGREVSPHDRLRRHLDLVRERLAVLAPRSVSVIHGGTVVVLAAHPRAGAPSAPKELAGALASAVQAVDGGPAATVAIGDTCRRPTDYAPAFELAREAIALVSRLGRAGRVIAVADLGPYALLLRASSREDLEAFSRRALAPLIDYDARHSGELLATLRAYIDEDRVQRRAATRLGVHVNTIVYRLRRIDELMSTSLASPEAVFDLTLALRILDVLGEPGQSSPSGERRVAQALPG